MGILGYSLLWGNDAGFISSTVALQTLLKPSRGVTPRRSPEIETLRLCRDLHGAAGDASERGPGFLKGFYKGYYTWRIVGLRK